jgi:hypothetical protein
MERPVGGHKAVLDKPRSGDHKEHANATIAGVP